MLVTQHDAIWWDGYEAGGRDMVWRITTAVLSLAIGFHFTVWMLGKFLDKVAQKGEHP